MLSQKMAGMEYMNKEFDAENDMRYSTIMKLMG
jgi:hypothetical protein